MSQAGWLGLGSDADVARATCLPTQRQSNCLTPEADPEQQLLVLMSSSEHLPKPDLYRVTAECISWASGHHDSLHHHLPLSA